ncbi:BamA/TamA family outer membrane protein [Pseudorhodobacter sp.]
MTGQRSGGTGFLGASLEVRAKVTDSIGVVGFADFGQIATDGLYGGTTASHAGAGFGLRYATGFGPIRLDIGVPVSGGGKKPQVYVGIGQSF